MTKSDNHIKSLYEEDLRNFLKDTEEEVQLFISDEYEIEDDGIYVEYWVQWLGTEFINDFVFGHLFKIEHIIFAQKIIKIKMPIECIYYKYTGPYFTRTL